MEWIREHRPVVIIAIGIIITVIVILLLHKYYVPKVNIIEDLSIVGVIASIVGIVITVTQVSSVKKEIARNNDSIRASHNIAEFHEESDRVRQIRDALPTKEFKYVMWQISVLKVFLVKQKSNPIVRNKEGRSGVFDDVILKLGMDVRNLTKKMDSGNSYMLDKDLISTHLDEVETLLAEINGELVNNSYEPK